MQERTRDKIQKEVDKILDFKTCDDWKEFLKNKGERHKIYYHYTTLTALWNILKSSSWMLRIANCSNDPSELSVHNSSFTTSSISSMGMWHMYSKLYSDKEIGVRIGIPAATFKKIFTPTVTLYQKDLSETMKEYCKTPLEIFDMAYWHFGKENKTDIAIYQNYELVGPRLKFHFSKGQKLPPYFKSAIWRSEKEVRVCCDLSQNGDNTDVFVKIEPELFKTMSFRLSPGNEKHENIQQFFKANSSLEAVRYLDAKISSNELTYEQFQMPNEYEQWQ